MQNHNLKQTTCMHRTKITEFFLNFCDELFQIKRFIEYESINIDYKSLHNKLLTLVRDAIEEEAKLSFNKNFKEAIYAMCVLADEILLNMQWEGKTYWENNMLEMRFFNTQYAGDEIFNRIDELLSKNHIENIEKCEVYLRVLSMGFQGKYRDTPDNKKEINRYRNALFNYIEKNDNSIIIVNNKIFLAEYTHTIPSIHRKLLPDASIVNYVCAFFIFMFLILSSCIWLYETKDISEIIAEISQLVLSQV